MTNSKTYIETLVGKRVRYVSQRNFKTWGWRRPDRVVLNDDGTFVVHFRDGSHNDVYNADGTNIDPDFNLIVHPDDMDLNARPANLTRAEIQAEIVRLQRQLTEIPDDFETYTMFMPWRRGMMGDILYTCEVGIPGDWEHISEVEIREVRRVR
jgi:hypothetical protein